MQTIKIKTLKRKIEAMKQKLKIKLKIIRPKTNDKNNVPTNSQIWVGESQSNTNSNKICDFESQISLLKSNFHSCPDYKIYEDYPVTPQKCSTYINLMPGNTPAPPLPPRYRKEGTPPLVQRTYRRKHQF